MVVVIFRDTNDRILIGECINEHNPCFGMLIPPGGKIDKGESAKDAVVREGFQETNLTADISSLCSVGHLNVRFTTSKILHIEIFEVRKWFAPLRAHSSREFRSLRFLGIDEIPWDKTPPGDEQMIKDILQGYKVNYRIWCGDSRRDVLHINPERSTRRRKLR